MFDKELYLKKQLNKLEKDVDSFLSLSEKGEVYKKIVNQVLAWYELDNLALFVIFNKSCGSGFSFFGNLYSFLVNTTLDDSYFKVIWEKYDQDSTGDFHLTPGEPWVDDPNIIWAYDGDKDASSDINLIWKIFQFWNNKNNQRIKDAEKFENLMGQFRKLQSK